MGRIYQTKLLTREEMEKLTTERLLAYKKRLYRVPEGPSYEETIYQGTDYGMHKQRPEWQETLRILKEVLASREHVDREAE